MLLFALTLQFFRQLPESLNVEAEAAVVFTVTTESAGVSQGAPGRTVYAKALAS